MKKEDIIWQLHRKIAKCRNEAKHYAEQAQSDPKNFAQWKELQGFYDGRVSAFRNAVMMLEDS